MKDAGILVGWPVALGIPPPEPVARLHGAVSESYLDGLRGAGWRDDPVDVRLGFILDAVMRGTLHACSLHHLVNDARREREEQYLGLPMTEVMEGPAGLTHVLLDLADEARALLGGA